MKKYLFFSLLIIVSFQTKAANFYWVGGSGNWSDYANHWATSSGGSTFQIQVPSPTDNVIFDVNSLINTNDTVTLDTTLIYMQDLTYTNALPVLLYTPTFVTLEIYGGIDLDTGLKLGMGGADPYIKMMGTGTYNIRTSGDTLSAGFYFNTTGDYSLIDELHVIDIFIMLGKFRTNDHSIYASNKFEAGGAPEVYLGTSSIYAYTVFFPGPAAFVMHAENSTFYCVDFTTMKPWTFYDVYCTNKFQASYSDFHNIEATWFSGSLGNFHNVKLNSTTYPSVFGATQCNFNKIEIDKGIYTGGGHFDTDTLIIHAGTDFTFNDTITINRLFQSSGDCAHPSSLKGVSSTNRGHIVMNSGTYFLDYNTFSFIAFSGGLTFTANNSFDLGSVSGITITAPVSKKLYWIGGSGNWDDETHWSSISGTPSDNCLPTPIDTVVFDNNSFMNYDTVKITSNSVCKTFIWNSNDTVLINNLIGTSQLTIYQSLLIDNPSTILLNLTHLHLVSNSQGNIISTNDAIINSSIDIIGTGGWSFDSDFTNLLETIIKGGTIRTERHRIKSRLLDFDLDNVAAFYMDSSLMEVGWHYENQPYTIIVDALHTDFIRSSVVSDIPMHCHDFIDCGGVELASNSTFHDMEIKSLQLGLSCTGRNVAVTDYQTSIQNIIIHGAVLNKITIDTRACIIGGQNAHIDTLISIRPGLALTIFEINVDNYLKLNGNCNGYITLSGSAYITGNTDLQNILFRNVTFTGNIPFSSLNSIFDGVNQGITLNNYTSRTLYWVNGSGNWGDSNHWSLTSGGSNGACIPTRYDDIVIDSLSLPSGNLEITLNYLTTECRTFSDFRQCKIKDNNNTTYINIYGNFITDSLFTAQVNQDYPITLICDTGTNYIDSRSVFLRRSIELKGHGNFDLLHELRDEYKIILRMGQLKTNGYPISVTDQLNIYNADTMNLFMDTSTITCAIFNFQALANSSILDFDSCIINSDHFIANNLDLNIVRSNGLSCITCTGNFFLANDIYHLDSSDVKELVTTTSSGTGRFLNSTIRKFEVNNSSARFFGSAQIDTLLFNTPGQDLRLEDFNISVTQHLEINSDPGFPSRFTSFIQNPCNINYSGDTLCTDFVYFDNITFSGSSPCFVGANSFDLGGNTGLNFTDCPIINYVNNLDLNSIKLFPNPSISGFIVSLNGTTQNEMSFTLYDVLGNIVIVKTLEKLTTEIQRNNITSGVYFYQIKDNIGNPINSGKLIFN